MSEYSDDKIKDTLSMDEDLAGEIRFQATPDRMMLSESEVASFADEENGFDAYKEEEEEDAEGMVMPHQPISFTFDVEETEPENEEVHEEQIEETESEVSLAEEEVSETPIDEEAPAEESVYEEVKEQAEEPVETALSDESPLEEAEETAKEPEEAEVPVEENSVDAVETEEAEEPVEDASEKPVFREAEDEVKEVAKETEAAESFETVSEEKTAANEEETPEEASEEDTPAEEEETAVREEDREEVKAPEKEPMPDLGPEPEPYVEPDIRDLYYDYTDKLAGIEDNRYFRYLYEMVKAGNNSFQQTNQILHKVVDQTWLATIEDSLDALNRIIANPRKFIKSVEEIVPVGLAKKINADSVKHLSRNTQFIVSDPEDPVEPTKVLNSSLEETYDLYENRFIYHLIQRLVRFIDKRTDVIFWATGDEKQNHLKFESKVDDAYEQIEYKLEMTIKNLTSFAENDADNMEVFARIDRLRRLVMSIRASSFCSIMSGCAAVRSPIQRTNLMIKDPDYRTCYKLWHFLENYDEVGYTIEVLDEAMAFDEEYVSQMYTNMVGGYTVFKSLMEEEDRVLSDELREKQRLAVQNKDITPKFITEIKEIPVDNRDIEDVEIRRVFVEEVTQAQLDAEEEAKQAEEAMKAAQAETAEARREIKEARQMQEEAERRAAEAEKRQHDAEAKVAEAQEEAHQAERERRAAVQRANDEINKARADADLQVIAAQEKAQDEASYQISRYRVEAEENVRMIKSDSAEEIRKAKEEADLQIRQSEERAVKAENTIALSEERARVAETKLQEKEEDYKQLYAEMEETAETVEKLTKKLEDSENLRASEGKRSLQRTADLEQSLLQAETELDREKRARKENEYQISVLKQALAASQEEKKQLAQKLGNRGVLKKWREE